MGWFVINNISWHFLSFISSLVYKKKWLNRIGQALKVTNRFGEEDLWDYFNDGLDKWVYVRDYKNNLTYRCRISNYSDYINDRELILEDVDVYDSATGKELYYVKVKYICLNKDDISIEISENVDNDKSVVEKKVAKKKK